MMKSEILREDFLGISENLDCINKLNGGTFLITGATGLIGSLFVKFLLFLSDEYDKDIKVIAIVRNEMKVRAVYGNLMSDERIKFIYADLTSASLQIDDHIDYIIHAASITASKQMIGDPVGVIDTALTGTRNVLRLAANHGIKGMIYLSSMEAYGVVDKADKICENEQGYIDITNVRSCYPQSKRMCETMCLSYYAQYGVPVMIARLAQTFGAGVSSEDNRVFAQFAQSVINGQDIVLHTDGLSEGNYVYTADAISALLLMLLCGKHGEIYNVSNEETHTTIRNMAQIVCDRFSDGASKVVFDIPTYNQYGYAPATHLFLDSSKLRSLGWAPKYDLIGCYDRLILYYCAKD